MRAFTFAASIAAMILASSAARADVPDCFGTDTMWGKNYEDNLAIAKKVGDRKAIALFNGLPRFVIYDYADRSKPICAMNAATYSPLPMGYEVIPEAKIASLANIKDGRIDLGFGVFPVAIIRQADFDGLTAKSEILTATYDRLRSEYHDEQYREEESAALAAQAVKDAAAARKAELAEREQEAEQRHYFAELAAQEAATRKEQDRIAARELATLKAREAARAAQVAAEIFGEYEHTHTGMLGVVNAIRATISPIGKWADDFWNAWWSQYLATALTVWLLAAGTTRDGSGAYGGEILLKIVAAMAAFLLVADLWAGQFGIEGWTDSAWRNDQAWSITWAEAAAVIATLIPGEVWRELGKSRGLRTLIAIPIAVIAGGVWIWPETVVGAVEIVIFGPLVLASIVLNIAFRLFGPTAFLGAVFGDGAVPETSRPERGPQTPTEHRSI